MHLVDNSESGLLILNELNGEYSAKCPEFFYLFIFPPDGGRQKRARIRAEVRRRRGVFAFGPEILVDRTWNKYAPGGSNYRQTWGKFYLAQNEEDAEEWDLRRP